MNGIDVSKFQGNINFSKVKESEISFVIIRAGYGNTPSQKDSCFEQNYKNARAAGLNVGAYWYSYADSIADARKEAKACLEVIKGKKFEFPIYFDLEERDQLEKGKTFCSDIVKAFCNELEKSGYFAGLYISRSPLQTHISTDVAKRYALWIAEYNPTCNYNGDYGMWQHSSTGKINGINGNVDLDICYIDYPSAIKSGGFNGYTKKSYSASVKTIAQLAQEVLDGKWGNGDERKRKLTAAGYDYSKVQNKVNELCAKRSVDEIAKEVIAGKWGNGEARKTAIANAGYDYNAVQKRVNELLKG